ncbi:MAG: hypothetical protein EAX86_10700 [Candidatus Heimdallarchaeota archaeon]|nr:hypothetical protein [Candidatus Heimdallarchaeota archaeon]
MAEDYSLWMGQELKKLIDLLANRSFQMNPDSLNAQIAEVRRGVEYGTSNPGSIDELLLKVARQFIDSLAVYMRQMRKSNTGIPPGGQATVLTGGTMDDFTPSQSDQFSVDELKGALASRKKKDLEGKMKGSMDLLKDQD